MNFFNQSLIVSLILSLLITGVNAAAPELSAQSASLYDVESGRFLFLKDPDTRLPIASTTKIMTSFVVIERCDLDEMVYIDPRAVGIEGSSIYLQNGDQFSVRALLYGLLLQSGNDAAVALAIHCAGSVEDFVDLMNEKAEFLGLNNTSFANPNGLDDEYNYSTARDMAILGAAAMANAQFAQIVSTKTINIEGRCFKNHNKLLWNYEGANGIKTGYTRLAGRTLVGSAKLDDVNLITVTLNDPDDWRDHASLFDYGFINFTDVYTVSRSQIISEIAVISGQSESVQLVSVEDLRFRISPEELVYVDIQTPDFVYAPVTGGDYAGKAVFYIGEERIGEVPLIYGQSVQSDPVKGIVNKIKDLFN